MTDTLGKIQPFRYRGYVYDVETGLYYLRSRYYKPDTGRFINADLLVKGNLFAYCSQNPVNFLDTDGRIEDYTNYINQVITDALPEFYAHGVSAPYKDSAVEILLNVDSYLWFMEQVNSEARWDVKHPDSWRSVFPELPVPKSNELFILRGLEITSEDLGNLLYGYFGTAMGISEVLLYAAGGVAKKYTHVSVDNTDEAYQILDSLVECYENKDEYYGDDKNDHIYIEKGIGMYRNDYLY